MPKKEAFVIPQGLQFEHSSKGVTIENQGDIVIKGSIGMSIHKLVSTDGNIHIEQPLSVSEIVALNGSVSSSTSLEVSTIQAKVLESAHSLTVRKRIHVSKQLLVHGDLNAPTVQSLGNLEIQGSLKCDELNVEGHANITHNVHAQSIHAHDTLEIGGHTTSEELIHSGTTLVLGSLETNTLDAVNSHVTVTNALSVSRVQCSDLVVSGDINVPTMQVSRTIQISDAAIQSDVVLCEQFTSTGDVAGKILVLEALNQDGVHRIKGCLELSDFKEFVPDIEHFLQARGLERQDGQLILTANERDDKATQDDSEDDSESSESSDSDSESSSEETSALHVNLNAIPAATETSISEESSMFHEDITTLEEEQEEIARPARIAVPIIDQSMNDQSMNEDKAQSPSADSESSPDEPELTDEVNLEQETAAVKLDESVRPESTDTDEVVLNVTIEENEPLQTDGDLDTPVATEVLMSEDWTYDEGDHSEGDSQSVAEPQVPETNPKHEAIRADILSLIDNYDDTKYPDAIRELLDYLETEDYLTLRDELRHLWSELLKHHQQEGSRIPHMATGAFTNLSKSLQAI